MDKYVSFLSWKWDFNQAIEAVIHQSKVKSHLSDATAQVIQRVSIALHAETKLLLWLMDEIWLYNQLRLVVYPSIYNVQGFSTIQPVVGNGISEPSTVGCLSVYNLNRIV